MRLFLWLSFLGHLWALSGPDFPQVQAGLGRSDGQLKLREALVIVFEMALLERNWGGGGIFPLYSP